MAAQAYYRKWRSQRFADLVGQEPVARTLRNAVRLHRVAHAYLLCGPRGVGKTSAARILAKAINCPEVQDGEPCATCATCRAIQDGSFIDVLELDAASNNRVEEIRDILEKVGLAPAVAQFKVYILDEAHMLSVSAANALLKTLEEPPPNTVFVLVTTDPQKLPATIVSRCQRLDFRRISVVDAVARLAYVCEQEGITPEAGVLDLLARAADGSLRDAEGALDQVVSFAGSAPTLAAARAVLGAAGPDAARDLIVALVDGEPDRALRLVNELVDQGADARQIGLDVVDCLRSLLLLRTSAQLAELVEVSPEVLAQLRRLAARPALSAPRLVALIRLFAPGPPSRGGVRPQLPLELNLVEAAQLLQSATAGPPAAVEPAPGPTAVPSARPSPPPAPAASAPVVPGAPVARGPAPPLAPVIAPAPSEPVPPSEVGRTSGILFEDAQRRWNEVLEACGSRNRSVQALLRAARPVELENQTLVLGFTYEFHRERIEDVKNRVVVEDTIERVLGRRFAVRCVLANKEAMKETTPAADAVQSAMEDPVVRAAISLGARVRSVTDDNTEEKR